MSEEAKKQGSSVKMLHLSKYVRPVIKEDSSKSWVMNGPKNSFYQYLLDRYNGSPTNRAIIDSYTKFIYGKGLMSKQQANKAMQFATIMKVLSKNDLRAVCADYSIFSEAAFEIIYKGGKIVALKHVPKNMVLPSKLNEDGNIESWWFSRDFNQPTKFVPVEFSDWHDTKKRVDGSYIYVFKTYQAGKTYFNDPAYLAGCPYAELEEELANYCVNHIKRGLSFGYIINFNNGVPDDETKRAIKKEIEEGLSGSSNAGAFVLAFNDNKDNAATIEAVQVSDAHRQYEFLSSEATQKIMIAHCVTSPILFGIKDNTGLGNNANEMEVAFNELTVNVIKPMQEVLTDGLMEIFASEGMNIDLDFIPLRPLAAAAQSATATTLSKVEDEATEVDDILADELISLGEDIDANEWECIDEREVDGEPTLTETNLHLSCAALKLAYVPSSFPERDSEQDTPLFKIRYQYSGNPTPQRSFCVKMMNSGKVFRKEDIEAAGRKAVNPGLGPYGSDTYPIWLFKGGKSCKHFWMRKIFLKNGDEVSRSKVREILNSLEPKVRRENDIQDNDSLVAKRPHDMPNQGGIQ